MNEVALNTEKTLSPAKMANPTSPLNSAKMANPANPASQANPAKMANPTSQANPARPANPASPTRPTRPANPAKTEAPVKAVIFDIDGTLYSNFMMLLSAPLRYLFSLHWILRYSRMRKTLRRRLKNSKIHTRAELEAQSLELFSQQFGLSENFARYILQSRIKNNWVLGLKKTALRLGMRRLISDLYHGGYKLGIISDFSSVSKLRNWSILEYFHSVVFAEDLGTLKPDRAVFDAAANTLQVANEECLYIGNHLLYDGLGAMNSGMKALVFTRYLSSHAPTGIHTIRTVKEIYQYLALQEGKKNEGSRGG